MKQKPLIALVALWLLAGGLGLLALLRYEKAPGQESHPPENWPSQSAIVSHGFTLVMFAHPQCPCTRASIGELAEIMARSGGKLAAHVLFMLPTGQSTAWSQSDLWRSAAAIPGVTVQTDLNETEARLFHATTSGQTLLYRDGHLLFAGGVTSGRGHAGDNPGRSAILAELAKPDGPTARTAVFGCALYSSAGSCQP